MNNYQIIGHEMDNKGVTVESSVDMYQPQELNYAKSSKPILHIFHGNRGDLIDFVKRIYLNDSEAAWFLILVGSEPARLKEMESTCEKDIRKILSENIHILSYSLPSFDSTKTKSEYDDRFQAFFEALDLSLSELESGTSASNFSGIVKKQIEKSLEINLENELQGTLAYMLLKRFDHTLLDSLSHDGFGRVVSPWQLHREHISHNLLKPSLNSLINRESFKRICEEGAFESSEFLEFMSNYKSISNTIKKLLDDAMPFAHPSQELALFYKLRQRIDDDPDQLANVLGLGTDIKTYLTEYIDKCITKEQADAIKLKVNSVQDTLSNVDSWLNIAASGGNVSSEDLLILFTDLSKHIGDLREI